MRNVADFLKTLLVRHPIKGLFFIPHKGMSKVELESEFLKKRGERVLFIGTPSVTLAQSLVP
jgi:hypothetical protein